MRITPRYEGAAVIDVDAVVRSPSAALVRQRARLAESLREDMPNVVVLHGGIQVKARRAALKRLANLSADEPRLVLATGRYIGAGPPC